MRDHDDPVYEYFWANYGCKDAKANDGRCDGCEYEYQDLRTLIVASGDDSEIARARQRIAERDVFLAEHRLCPRRADPSTEE